MILLNKINEEDLDVRLYIIGDHTLDVVVADGSHTDYEHEGASASVSFNNFDPNPEKIMVRRTRRDDWRTGFDFNSDWVGIGIDSRNDDKTGYWFAVNAAEVQVDVAITGEGYGGFDGTWNAVWYSKVSFHNDGWSAEIRIPFNVFQYSSALGYGSNTAATYSYSTIASSHGTHVAGTVAGNTQGWARDANIYNMEFASTAGGNNGITGLWWYDIMF